MRALLGLEVSVVRVVVVVAAAALLAGCQSKAAQERQAAETAKSDDAYCQGLGVKPGADAYVQCRLTLRQQAAAEDAAARARISRTLDGMAANIRGPQSVNCSTRPSLGGFDTTCQ